MSFTVPQDPERPAHQRGEPERPADQPGVPERDQPKRDQPKRDQPKRDQPKRVERERADSMRGDAERGDRKRGERAGPEPGSLENPVEITDPRALRALAHPARLAILQHLGLDGPATATECAEVVGLSPSACSYHLRALARYGFVDEDPSGGVDRRHRPWRARVVAIKGESDPKRPAAFRAASRLLVESMQARVDEVRANYLDRETEYSPDWQRAAGWGQDVLHVTPAELDQVRAKIYAILAEYRRLSREDQPADSRRVHVMLDFTPWFTPDADV